MVFVNIGCFVFVEGTLFGAGWQGTPKRNATFGVNPPYFKTDPFVGLRSKFAGVGVFLQAMMQKVALSRVKPSPPVVGGSAFWRTHLSVPYKSANACVLCPGPNVRYLIWCDVLSCLVPLL